VLGRDSGPRPRGLHDWQPVALARSNSRGGDTSAHPAVGGGLLAQELTGGLCGERWMAQVRRECEGRVKQGEVCHGSPRRSGVDDAVESGMDGGVLATVDDSRGLAVIQHCPCRAVRGRGR
jgi:hypothetical protein